MTKRIGILTSGGDCAGLNATIRAVALRAHHGYGWTDADAEVWEAMVKERDAGRAMASAGERGESELERGGALPG